MREVHGAGTLKPEDIRIVTSRASGRVERIILRPGAVVKPGTPILELTNPDLRQQQNDAKLAWTAAEAALKLAQSTFRTTRSREDSNVSTAKSRYNVAVAEFQAQKKLQEQGLVSDLVIKRLEASVDQEKTALEMAEKQRDATIATEESTLAPESTAATTAKARYETVTQQVDDLLVKSPMAGILQEVTLEVGVSVQAGGNLARVSDSRRSSRLKSESLKRRRATWPSARSPRSTPGSASSKDTSHASTRRRRGHGGRGCHAGRAAARGRQARPERGRHDRTPAARKRPVSWKVRRSARRTPPSRCSRSNPTATPCGRR